MLLHLSDATSKSFRQRIVLEVTMKKLRERLARFFFPAPNLRW